MDIFGGFMLDSFKRKMKENKNLLPSSRKETGEPKPRLSRKVTFESREFTEEQRIEHQARLKRNKRSDQVRLAVLALIIIGAIVALVVYG